MSMNYKYERLSYELSQNGFSIDNVQKSVLEKAIENGFELLNNHLMAYTDNTKTWYIDQWL